jgi:putative transposase
MPRTARAAVGGYCYYTVNRGNRRAEVFHDADDYAAFAGLLREATAPVPMRVLAWGLVPPISSTPSCGPRGTRASPAGCTGC